MLQHYAGERNQSDKTPYCMILYNVFRSYLYKIDKSIETECKAMVSRDWGFVRGERNDSQ